MTIFLAVDILTNIFEAFMIFMFFDSYLDTYNNFPKYLYYVGVFILALLIEISTNFCESKILSLCLITLNIFFASFLFRSYITTKFIISILSVLIIAILEVITMFCIIHIQNITMFESIDNDNWQLTGTFISNILIFSVFKVICVKKSKLSYKISNLYWILLSSILLISLLIIFLIFELQYFNTNRFLYNLSLMCSAGLLYIVLFTMYLYDQIIKRAELMNKQKVYEQHIKSCSKHLDEILLTQKELKTFKHDLSNHLIYLYTFFEQKRYDEGIAYIDTINHITRTYSNEIETGNIALDTLINTKKFVAKSKDIEFVTNLQITENLPIDPIDSCIIFGNALDNAIEACDKLHNKYKKITISIIYEYNSIICKITNTFSSTNNYFLHTTKIDRKNHGFGIENIKNTLSKYRHIFRICTLEDEFVLSFIIFQD